MEVNALRVENTALKARLEADKQNIQAEVDALRARGKPFKAKKEGATDKTCWRCDRPGHLQRQCIAKKKLNGDPIVDKKKVPPRPQLNQVVDLPPSSGASSLPNEEY